MLPGEKYWNRVKRRDYLIVHEFGHTLGFGHEHDRPDATGECGLLGPESVIDGETLYMGYDPNSIMNYCGPDSGNLSALDKQGMVAAYGPRVLTIQSPILSPIGEQSLVKLRGNNVDAICEFHRVGNRLAQSPPRRKLVQK